MKSSEVMTLTELKTMLRIHYNRAKKLLDDGIIPGIKINERGDWRILREDVIDYMRSGNKNKTA